MGKYLLPIAIWLLTSLLHQPEGPPFFAAGRAISGLPLLFLILPAQTSLTGFATFNLLRCH